MSRRKQTKPFKVEEKEPEVRRERRAKSRRSTRESETIYTQSDQLSSDTLNEEETSSRNRNGTKCDECGKVLASSLSLARHKLTHSENKPYRCPHCNAGFKTSSNMHRHVRIHYRENSKDQSDSDVAASKPRTVSSQRTPRQNIRTPNKFREFDVDLVGVGPRGASDIQTRSHQKYHEEKSVDKEESDRKFSESSTLEKDSAKIIDQDDELSESYESQPTAVDGNSVKPEDLVCHICNKTFISKFGLLTHTLSHSEQETSKPTMCHLCHQTFSTQRGLMVHNVIEHKISGNKTDARGKKFFKEIAVMDFSAAKFPCMAEKACSSSRCAPPLRDTEHIFLCKKCDASFPLLSALDIHIKNNHGKAREMKSQENNDDEASLMLYLELYSKDTFLKQKETKNTFNVVNGEDNDEIYTSKLVAIKQIPEWLQKQPDTEISAYDKEPEGESVPYESRRATSSDEDTASLTKYVNTGTPKVDDKKDSPTTLSYTPGKRKVRNQVDSSSILRRFDSSNQPRMEMEKLAGERNVFWCRICNYSSHEKSALVRHLLTHSGIRPYFCTICDYAFTTKANCERHVRKRHNCITRAELDAAVRCDWELLKKAPREDIYMISASNSSCPVCQKSFSCNNDLKLHMKSHEERHFVCQLCNVRCTTRNNCVRHILHKHPGIPHQEANNIITFCGNGQNDLDLDIDVMTDVTEDANVIDISRGRIGGRAVGNQSSRWKKSNYSRRPDSDQPLPKRPRVEGLSAHDSSAVDEQEEENVEGQDQAEMRINENTPSVVSTNKNVKVLPLIPLLKIKAYNDAAAKSYAEMVALYQHLSFLNPIQTNSNQLDVLAAEDTAAAEVDSSEKMMTEDDTYLAGETTFVCHTCAKAFDTKELLKNHIPQCEYNANDIENFNDPGELFFNAEENEQQPHNAFVMDDASITKNSESMDAVDWNQQNDEDDDMIADDLKSRLSDWYGNATPSSPYNIRSADETASSQEHDSAYGSDSKQRVTSYGKEPSYVEDSLLMSMFGDGSTSESEARSTREISNSRYSSGLPTMVDMGGSTISTGSYQGALDGDDKTKNKAYHGRKCPQCNKTFPWASSLRRHIMTHTGLKLYMCRLCKMRFTTRSNLIRHVYRRHGMAKQHPDFASCLAKLNPSDSLLREVEADVRRRIDVKRKRIPGTRNAYERTHSSSNEAASIISSGKKKNSKFNDFQSMLEDDPETMLVDLDYSPRDELNGLDENKQSDVHAQEQEFDDPGPADEEEAEEEEEVAAENEEELPVTFNSPTKPEVKPNIEDLSTRSDASGSAEGTHNGNKTPIKVELPSETPEPSPKHSGKSSRNKQSDHFVCGLCKKIFKTVQELITHLDVHDVPHCWHCPICGVPFTNKYNCQRHLSRRHGRVDIDPKYVEDSKHGPRNARGLPKTTRPSLDWKAKKMNWHAT